MIYSSSYQAEEGMTWEEWVASDYNIDGFTIVTNMYVKDHDYETVCLDKLGSELVVPSDLIIANRSYFTCLN